jgi:hypothetical protein
MLAKKVNAVLFGEFSLNYLEQQIVEQNHEIKTPFKPFNHRHSDSCL